MRIFKIDVSNKIGDFSSLYSILDEKTKYAIYPHNFVVISLDNEDITEFLKDEKDIIIKEVENIEKEIPLLFIKNWINEEYIKDLHSKAEVEVNKRTAAMYEILNEAEKKLKGDENVAKQAKRQNKSSKNETDGKQSAK